MVTDPPVSRTDWTMALCCGRGPTPSTTLLYLRYSTTLLRMSIRLGHATSHSWSTGHLKSPRSTASLSLPSWASRGSHTNLQISTSAAGPMKVRSTSMTLQSE
ncbi:MAG: hypothetical protein ACTSSA_10985, partial [Candidatus Freyarchaeota archaeon]